MAAVSARIVRASLLEVLEQDYIATARGKGLGEGAVLWRHALRNAFIPVVTVLGLQLNHLIGGTVIVETVFARPGVGKLIVDAIESRDIPILQGCVLFLAASFSLINLIVDVSCLFRPAHPL
jgi:peptide/nickel transport system permease protein